MAFGQNGRGDGQFIYPFALAVDSLGYIYVADGENPCIQKFDGDGKFVTKLAGPGNAAGQLTGPIYMAIDDQDNLYIADVLNGNIQKFSRDGKFLARWDQCGASPWRQPFGVAVDKQGNIYVAEYGLSNPNDKPEFGHRVCKLDRAGNFLYAWGGRGTGDGRMLRPGGIAVDDAGNVYVGETGNHRVQKFQQQ